MTWLERLEAATSQAARDEILLRELKACAKDVRVGTRWGLVERSFDEIEEQLRLLASRALPVI